MENIPQPSKSPYKPGDKVRVYLGKDDIDSNYHGLLCVVLVDQPDELGEVTGRDIDDHHYSLRRVDTGEELPIDFRHADLVPASEWPVRE